ncbi:roundabout homolog 2-like [Anneissia japonica]|uniref:roundabout homolog 2-like n=1 Tax=Anneissia japonica TaxID=1529436 RepID=UPI0014257FFE|nr:roundabout homolog 2-like [Anneissia japonica]
MVLRMMIKLSLVFIVFFNRVYSQVDITFPSTDAVAGDDARLECAFNLETRTYRASFLIQSYVDGRQGDTLVGSSSTSAPVSKYRVEEDLTNNRVFFVITNTTRSDEGYYLCLIQNSGFDVISGDPAKLTVLFIDTVTIDVIPNPVTEGNDVTFNCSVNANPIPTITLLKDDTEVKSETSSNLTYKLYSVDKRNGGNYKCKASNMAGTSTSPMKVLDVQFTIDVIPNPVTEGNNVTFTCFVNANPILTITLLKDDTEVKSETSSNLTYKLYSVDKRNGGNYKCKASNIAGTSTSPIKVLDVQYLPEITLPDNMTVTPGGNAFIEPNILANPDDITYQWITDPPGIDDVDSNPATFTFKVPNVVDTNYTITVTATNSIGSTTESVIVIVAGVDYCISSPCENEGNCIPPYSEFTCECKPGYSGRYCENVYSGAACSSSTSLTIGMLFVGIIVGAFGVIGGLIGYTRIKQKAQIDKRSTDKKKQDTYMDYMTDRSIAGNENQTYQDLQHRDEETAYVNVKPGKR